MDGLARSAAAARGHRQPWSRCAQAPGPAFPARPQPHPAHRPRPPRRSTRARSSRSAPVLAGSRAPCCLRAPSRVVAVEVDFARRWRPARACPGAPGTACRSSRRTRWRSMSPASGPPPRRIVANLPYNVSTALLVRWLHQADEVAEMVLMFQKEVADRLAAAPRTKDYGRLSVAGPARLHGAAPVRRGALGVRAAAQGRFQRGPADAHGPRRPAGRSEAAGEGHGRGLRPAPQDAAQLPGRVLADPVAVLTGLGIPPTARAEELCCGRVRAAGRRA